MGDGEDPFAETIDWDAYWRGDCEETDYPARVGANKVELFDRFFETVGVPGDAAFVGCGTAELPAAVAREYDTDVVGYDAARSVLARNREAYADVPNLSFERAVLPAFDVDREFEFVYSYATLHYVADVEAAIEAMYRRVRSGGHLVCNYPNEATRESHGDLEGRDRERFRLVVEGETLTTRERVAERLDAPVRDFWTLVDADGPFVRPANPCVAVER